MSMPIKEIHPDADEVVSCFSGEERLYSPPGKPGEEAVMPTGEFDLRRGEGIAYRRKIARSEVRVVGRINLGLPMLLN